jgi:hypothetical protein
LQRDVTVGGVRGAGGEREIDFAPDGGDMNAELSGDLLVSVTGDDGREHFAAALEAGFAPVTREFAPFLAVAGALVGGGDEGGVFGREFGKHKRDCSRDF